VHQWLKIVAGNGAVLLTLFALVDVALRWTPFDQARQPANLEPPGYYVADAELGATLARNAPAAEFRFHGPPHQVFTNEIGCFDKPVRLGPDEPYILATGDSFTWGYAPLEEKWTSHIERATGIRVVKCGISGTGTRHQLARLKRLYGRLPHPPALVIHLYDTTDFNDDFTFPAYTVVSGKRVRTFERIRLSDGHREPLTPQSRARMARQIATGRAGFLERHSTLYNLAAMGLLVDERVERRRLVTEGRKETHLEDKYDFNLMLLDGKEYPLVASALDAHTDRLRQMDAFVRAHGGKYAMFHTNSFRLPGDKPLVRRFKAFLDGFEPFLAWLPELDKYMFDPHWTPESNAAAAGVMIERLTREGLLPLPSAGERRQISRHDTGATEPHRWALDSPRETR
jgi:hypothetical protein